MEEIPTHREASVGEGVSTPSARRPGSILVSHRLDGAFVRVDRAGQHLEELRKQISAFIEAEQDAVLSQFEAGSIREPYFAVGTRITVPHVFGVLVGECCYSLRAALDYLVYELVRLDCGEYRKGTQFPIVDSKAEFERKADRALGGVSAAYRARIEECQPYKGADWARLLRDVSNPDKHRTLTAVWGDTVGYLTKSQDPNAIQHVSGPIRGVRDSAGRDQYVKFFLHLEVFFLGGPEICQALDDVRLNVARVLDSFRSDFPAVGPMRRAVADPVPMKPIGHD